MVAKKFILHVLKAAALFYYFTIYVTQRRILQTMKNQQFILNSPCNMPKSQVAVS